MESTMRNIEINFADFPLINNSGYFSFGKNNGLRQFVDQFSKKLDLNDNYNLNP